MADLMALTLHRPWSDLIATGQKKVENRGWSTHYRGLVLVHSGRAYDPSALVLTRHLGHPDPPTEQDSPLGHIAIAELVDVHPAGPQCGEACDGYGMAEQHHWIWGGVLRLPEPIAERGRQGLWLPSAETRALAEAVLARGR